MKPTPLDIEQAGKLKPYIDSKIWIILTKDNNYEFYNGSLKDFEFDPLRARFENCKKIIGPLSNCEEVWPVLCKLIGSTPQYDALGLLHQAMVDQVQYENLAQAMRQALINLKEKG